MNTALLLLVLHVVPPPGCDTVVVCPREFRGALQPWLDYRGAEGRTFAFVSNLESAEGIRAGIRRTALGGRLRFVVLVGDAQPRSDDSPAIRAHSVPTHFEPAKVNVRWGSEPEIATDNWYADLDGDRVPDVAIGRLSADSPAQLSVIVGKILAYEQNRDFGPWRRRINFVAGISGFGALADSVCEITARKLIGDGVPADYATSMTYSSWRSPYCPDPRQFRDTALARLNEGCMFFVYLGHGHPQGLAQLQVPGARYPVLSCPDVAGLHCHSGAAIACMLTCYTGAFDRPEDCLAERMLRTEGAPVAVICGSRVTMPYAMSVLGTQLLDECLVRHSGTLGEALLAAKRGMVSPEKKDARRRALDFLASVVTPGLVDLAAERMEHLDLFNLLGDPALRLHFPREMELQAPRKIAPGEDIEIAGQCPIDGSGTVELVVRRDRLTFTAPVRERYDAAPNELTAYNDTYRRANDPCLSQIRLPIRSGPFTAKLRVPAEASGACHVRVFVEGANDSAMGAADVEVEAGGDAE